MKRLKTPYLIFGFIIGIILISISVYLMGGGHGSYTFANKTFPIPMLIAVLSGKIGFTSIIISFLQYPIYFWTIFIQKSRKGEIIALTIISLIHILAIMTFNSIESNQF